MINVGLLILEFARVVREALPKAFVMENVQGMVNWESGKALDAVMNELREPVITKVRSTTTKSVIMFLMRLTMALLSLGKGFLLLVIGLKKTLYFLSHTWF